MDRRTALAAAGAVVLTVAAGAVAVAANLGLIQQADTGVGQLQPVALAGTPSAAPSDTETIYLDEYVTPDASGAAATNDGSAVPAPAPPVAGDDLGYEEWDDDAYEDDDSDDSYDDEDEHHDGDDEDDEDDDEYEGGEDDD